MELIRQYFPELNKIQIEQLTALKDLYTSWNEKINVISRKDIDHLYLHHVLHSLALVKLNVLQNGMKVLDVGTGGGFPGVPLAIVYPEVSFTLLDATAKKIHVVKEVANALGLNNIEAVHARVEKHEGSYDLVVSRAVSSLTQIIDWTKHLAAAGHWIAYKGGDAKELRKELTPVYKMEFIPVSRYFKEDYFNEKYIIDIRKVAV
jgi:16S rRNA (guanine527-N7)-methyltransferase